MGGAVAGVTDAAPRRRRGRRWFLAAAALALLAAVGMHEHVRWSAAPFQVAIADVPVADLVVVPGARIHADGTPYAMLEDRLAQALELWHAGKAPRLLLSGYSGSGIANDEVAAMRRWLAARGVPAHALAGDGDGLRTLATMRRCRDVFGARRVVVVTNGFHVARTVFLGRSLGLEVYGVAAPYRHEHALATLARNEGREVLARVRAWLDVFVLGADH